MFPRRLRLSRRGFTAASSDSSAKRATTPHFSASVSSLSDASGGCAVVVSKKVAKSAVARHLLKRRARSTLQPWCSPTHGLIVYARVGSNELTFQQIEEEINQLLPRLGLSRTM